MQRRDFLRTTALTTGGLLLAQKEMLAVLLQQPAFKITMLTEDAGHLYREGWHHFICAG